jgi:hypothetical protein
MPMSSNKFCVDCKHILRYPDENQCAREILDLVTGNMISLNKKCPEERYLGACGEAAKYFEAKKCTS